MDLPVTMVNYKKYILDGESKTNQNLPTKVTNVAIGAVNTLILTNSGKLFIFGSNNYGQAGQTATQIKESETECKKRRHDVNRLLEYLSSPYVIEMPFKKPIVVTGISMGSYHVIVVSKYGEMFSWGRNDDGQLSHGFMTNKIETPKLIESMLHERIKSVHASENYSACLSHFGCLYTCGSGEFGKLGNGISKDCQSDFEKVETDCPIKNVSLGIHHMAAIADYKEKDVYGRDGRTLVWGRNHKGQLGIGSRDQCSRPEECTKLHSLNIRLIQIQCGATFTLGLTNENRLVYFGDKNYSIDGGEEDIKEPKEVDKVKDSCEYISVSYTKMLAIQHKGNVLELGNFLSFDGSQQSKMGSSGKVEFKQDALMKKIFTGPYHCCSISHSYDLYCWGFDRMGSTGLPIKKEQFEQKMNRKINRPRIVIYFVKEFEKNIVLMKDNKAQVFDNNRREKALIAPGEDQDEGLPEDEILEEEEKKVQPLHMNAQNQPKTQTHTGEEGFTQKGQPKKTRALDLKMLAKGVNHLFQKSIIDMNSDILVPQNFILQSNINSLSLTKDDKFHSLHKYLVDEKNNK